MALSRVKTWIVETLTHTDLNAEFDNILNNARDLVSPLTGSFDMNGFELILDADADTSITADTDDQIDFRLGGSDFFRMIGGVFYLNDNSNALMSQGFTLNQGAFDDEIFAGKSSDIAHGMTSSAETDTYFNFQKQSANDGGLQITGYTEVTNALYLAGYGVTDDTTKSTAGTAFITLAAGKKSGTAVGAPGADANMVVIKTAAGNTRFIFDADGDSHQDVGTAWTNFHGHDDHELLSVLSAHVSRADDPIREQFSGFLQKNRDVLQQARLVTFNDDGHHFVNMSKLAMLHTGAILQAGDRITELETKIAELNEVIEQCLKLPKP